MNSSYHLITEKITAPNIYTVTFAQNYLEMLLKVIFSSYLSNNVFKASYKLKKTLFLISLVGEMACLTLKAHITRVVPKVIPRAQHSHILIAVQPYQTRQKSRILTSIAVHFCPPPPATDEMMIRMKIEWNYWIIGHFSPNFSTFYQIFK